MGNVVSEAEYRYDSAEDSYWYPPVACTLSEFALLSVGVNPHKYIVLPAFIEEEDRMRSAVFPWVVLDGVIRGRDRLIMDGRELIAGALYEQLRKAVLQENIPTAAAYKGVPEQFQNFSFKVLKGFAEENLQKLLRGQPGPSAAKQPSPVSLLIAQLAARTGGDAMPRLLVVLEAYRRIYEEHQALTEEEEHQLLKDLWRERTGKILKPTPVKKLAYVLKTIHDSDPGRRRRGAP